MSLFSLPVARPCWATWTSGGFGVEATGVQVFEQLPHSADVKVFTSGRIVLVSEEGALTPRSWTLGIYPRNFAPVRLFGGLEISIWEDKI